MSNAAFQQPHLDHYVRLAQEPGWFSYVYGEVRSKEDKDDCGLWQGFFEAWRTQLRATGFVPEPQDLKQWWVLPTLAQTIWASRHDPLPKPRPLAEPGPLAARSDAKPKAQRKVRRA
jgi:hypothetical protein